MNEVSERNWTGVFPGSPYGGQALFEITVHRFGNTQQVPVCLVLPADGGPVNVSIRARVAAFPPPPPPETDLQRRERLIADVVRVFRDAGRLGLNKQDAVEFAAAVRVALDGEFVEDCDLDHYEDV